MWFYNFYFKHSSAGRDYEKRRYIYIRSDFISVSKKKVYIRLLKTRSENIVCVANRIDINLHSPLKCAVQRQLLSYYNPLAFTHVHNNHGIYQSEQPVTSRSCKWESLCCESRALLLLKTLQYLNLKLRLRLRGIIPLHFAICPIDVYRNKTVAFTSTTSVVQVTF
jgi:hypothetical protein